MDTLSDDQMAHLICRARGRGVAAEVCQQRLIEAYWHLALWWEDPELSSTAFMIVAWAICGRVAEYHEWWEKGILQRKETRKPIAPIPADIRTRKELDGYILSKLAHVVEQHRREQETAEQRRARRANIGLPATASTVQQSGQWRWVDADGLSEVPDGLPEYRVRSPQEQPGNRLEQQEETAAQVKELDRLSEHCRVERERQVLALARAVALGEDIGNAWRASGLTVGYWQWLLNELRRRASDAVIRSPVRRPALYITGRRASAHT